MSYWKLTYYIFSPLIILFVMLLRRGWIENDYFFTDEPKIVGLLCILTLASYGVLFIGWGSNSIYPMLGVYRVLALIISYEVCMLLLLLLFFFFILDRINFYMIWKLQEGCWLVSLSFFLFLIWVIVVASELNRSPFDLAEGESEIVSGVNTEYVGGLFSFLFIAEYGIMILLRIVTVFLFFGGITFLVIKTFIYCSLLVWIRCSIPRIRYDNYIIVCWKLFIPLLLIFLLFLLLMY